MKSFAKGILCAVAVISLLFSMTSCTGEKAPNKEPSKSSSEPSKVLGERQKSIE